MYRILRLIETKPTINGSFNIEIQSQTKKMKNKMFKSILQYGLTINWNITSTCCNNGFKLRLIEVLMENKVLLRWHKDR